MQGGQSVVMGVGDHGMMKDKPRDPCMPNASTWPLPRPAASAHVPRPYLTMPLLVMGCASMPATGEVGPLRTGGMGASSITGPGVNRPPGVVASSLLVVERSGAITAAAQRGSGKQRE